jgi:hypothetical protein
MESQTSITLLTILLPLIGAGIGYFIKSNIEKKKELTNEVTKERRLIYQQYVNLIIDLFANTKNEKPLNQTHLIQELNEFYKKYVLYASPNVIEAYSNFFQFSYKNEAKTPDINKLIPLLTKIMLEMREDLGLKNNKLGKNGTILLRALIKDFDDVIKF